MLRIYEMYMMYELNKANGMHSMANKIRKRLINNLTTEQKIEFIFYEILKDMSDVRVLHLGDQLFKEEEK